MATTAPAVDFRQRRLAPHLPVGRVLERAHMSVPSLRVDDHRRFTPEMRDEVRDKLRQEGRATGGPTYRMLRPQHLRSNRLRHR